jgi:protocatechuate 4,5-dioxygenase alpha chain
MAADLKEPGFNLDAPGTYVFDGPCSTRGYGLNRFALSLKQPANRERFLADEQAYAAAFGLSAIELAMVARRDWTGLLEQGGHVQAITKLAATVGQTLFHIGAHNCGVDVETFLDACPRRVSGLGRIDG